MKDIIEIDELVRNLKKLPNVTSKQADKIVQHILNANEEEVEELLSAIRNVRDHIQYCQKCNNISLTTICDICSNELRNKEQVCIVSSPEDVDKIENTNSYSGVYFVLHEEVNVKKKTPLNRKTTQKLLNYLKENEVKEIILATNWTPNGEATAIFIKGIVNQMYPSVSIYRLAVGLPINSALNYADNETLAHSLKNKTKY
ncbi:MAG: recombination protein RecR [Malacoplasma sp.]|nr:recombination protein RecR [Malacoplasma sp.]